MKKVLFALFVSLFALPSLAFGQGTNTLYIPLIAAGGGTTYAADGITVIDGYTTDVTGTNLTTVFTEPEFVFWGQDGHVLNLNARAPIENELRPNTNEIQIELQKNSSEQFSVTLLSPNVVDGYMQVSVSQAADGSSSAQISSQYSFRVAGTVVGQATVPAVPASIGGAFYGQSDQSTDTGIAVVNPNPNDTTVKFTCQDFNGNAALSFSELVPAWNQVSKFIDELNPSIGTYQGQCRFQADVPVAATVFRTTRGGPFNFSTVSVYPLAPENFE